MFQVLAKASKIIPVMIMGKIISRKKYEYYEYVTAVLISVGMTFFMLGSADDHKGNIMMFLYHVLSNCIIIALL
jgi:adenosine 3'-phospho 5'-phosphosulfate transporter B2